jgi:hypothetical protein
LSALPIGLERKEWARALRGRNEPSSKRWSPANAMNRREAARGRLTQAIQAPINIVGRAGTPDVATLNRLGVKRADAPIRDIDEAAARIRSARNAAREAGIPIVINARIDTYLKQVGDPASRFTETVRRAEAYLAAGADCVFPFAVTDADTIASRQLPVSP